MGWCASLGAGRQCARSSEAASLSGIEESANLLQNRIRGTQLALPDHKGAPAKIVEFCQVFSVAFTGPGELRQPIVEVGFRQSSDGASWVGMPMPEAAMYEDHGAVLPQREVGLAGQIASVQPEAVAHSVGH